MPKKYDAHYMQNLNNAIDPDYLGIIWISQDPLQEKKPLFYQMDYLFDGLLNKMVRLKHPDKKGLFIGRSFGRPFFMAYFPKDTPHLKENLQETLSLVKNLNSKCKKILILGEEFCFIGKHHKEFIFHRA